MSLTPEDIKELRRLLTEADRLAGDADANGYTEGALRPAVRAQRAAEIALRNAAPALLTAAEDLALLRASLTVPERYVGVVTEAVAEELERVKAERDEMAAAGRTVVEAAEEGWADIEAQLQAKIEELDEHRRYTATVEADLAALRLEHESWGAIIDGLRATVAEMKAQRDADVMTALMRQSEVFDVTFATVTRERDEARADMADVQARYARAWEALCHIGEAIEVAGHPQLLPERALRVGEGVAKIIGERDEARKALATEEHNHELTIARRDDAQSWADSLANQIAEAAGHEIGEHSNLNNPWDNAQDGLVKLVRERDELRAALLNERGEGPPPSEGWARNDFDRRAVGIAWYRPSNADGSPPPAGAMDYAYVLWVYREPMEPEWTWECEHADFSSRNIQGKAPTAREAMRAADTALAGAKS